MTEAQPDSLRSECAEQGMKRRHALKIVKMISVLFSFRLSIEVAVKVL
jgi:hypothetical protein